MELMKDKIILVTGSSDGIGKQTAADLAGLGASVIVHGRDKARTEKAVDDVRRISGSADVTGVSCDLSSMEEIRALSGQLHEQYDSIDVLINNAGVYKNQRHTSRDGFELTFAVNHLAYFLLTGLLLDLLTRSSYARIVNVASQAHASKLDFENLQGERFYEGYDAYARSKLCNIMFTYRLAELLTESHVTANVLHPGVIATKLLHEGWGSGGSSLHQGSGTSIYLAASEEVTGLSGKYFSNRRMVNSASVSYDPSLQAKLWSASEEMTGFKYGNPG